jgi:hypothetical protein
MKIESALTGIARLGFDTSPIIYFVEANPRYDALITEIASGKANGFSRWMKASQCRRRWEQ